MKIERIIKILLSVAMTMLVITNTYVFAEDKGPGTTFKTPGSYGQGTYDETAQARCFINWW